MKTESLSMRLAPEVRGMLDDITEAEERTMTKVVERMIRRRHREISTSPLDEWTPELEAARLILCHNLIAMSASIEAGRPDVFNQSDAERLREAEMAMTLMADIIARARAPKGD